MNFPTLYKLTSTGKVQMWEIRASPGRRGYEMSEARITTTYGLLDGKKQTSTEVITRGKNIGKTNETSVYEQAQLEAKSQWEKKSKKGYVQNIEDAKEKKVDSTFVAGGIAPMLAHSFDKHGDKIQFPAYVQPKLDGHRCLAVFGDENVTLWSRTQKQITSMTHIQDALNQVLAGATGVVLDGELYNHDYKDRFEELSSEIRQVVPRPGGKIVQYWIYDVVVNGGFRGRKIVLDGLDGSIKAHGLENTLVVIPTEEVVDKEELMIVQEVYTHLGFEGAMVRNIEGNYKHGRSYDLQKVKTFEDAEFPVVAIEQGKGKMAGLAMFVCELPDGNTFRVKMVGALDDLKHYYDNPEPWIGKPLTVKYQGLSAYGVPRFPVALRFREDI